MSVLADLSDVWYWVMANSTSPSVWRHCLSPRYASAGESLGKKAVVVRTSYTGARRVCPFSEKTVPGGGGSEFIQAVMQRCSTAHIPGNSRFSDLTI